MLDKTEKVYIVNFMSYTNCMNNAVSNGETYLDIGYEPFLVRESDLDYYRQFGGGYRDLKFVGNIAIDTGNDILRRDIH